MIKVSQSMMGQPKQSPVVSLTDMGKLDRNSDVPLYFQLAAALKVMLEVEPREAGTRFASERELEERFKVSRAVIRPALDLLVGDGAIVKAKGSGAFVAPPRQEVRVAGLVRLSIERHPDPAITVLSARERQPDRTVLHFLEIEDEDRRTPLAHIVAVVDLADPSEALAHPSVVLVDSFSTVADVPWLLPAAHALKAGAKPPEPDGLELTRATVSIEHTFFGEWGSSQVGATAGDPALMGRFVQFGRPSRSAWERPLEFARLIYRADSTQLAFELS
jgi:GntR family transcriptional regulator, N-acetylglucosamine utilization regulator